MQIACLSRLIPPTGVYLVCPAAIAWRAASLIRSGVSKSGSPAASDITLTPASFSSVARASAAIVADGRSAATLRLSLTIRGFLYLTQRDQTGGGSLVNAA